ncbi:MAG: SulP family inorganic anion transporter [Acidobacteria bacterium]|nr:SulP family inorganic anion transporter [Acidobacteriota bacterium]
MKAGLRENFAKDFLASVVVFLVALPLCMGIAIASGVPPALGLITGIVGGLVVGTIAGSPLQVSGPAAGLTVLVWEMIQQHGIGMLGAIVLLAGFLQLLMGALRMGQWFRAISPAVIQGMLAGIGVLIIASQIHVMVDDGPKGSGLTNLLSIPAAIYKGVMPVDGSSHHIAAAIGLITMGLIFAWSYVPKKLQVVPAPLVAIVVVTIGVMFVGAPVKYVNVPGNLASVITFPTLESLGNLLSLSVVGSAVALCFIASAETLLCATAVDRMHNGERTNYNKELFAQGVGNSICGLFGALPMTGVIVRSSANVNAGGKTRASAILHGAWILGLVALAPFILNKIPTTALAAILVYTGFKLLSPKAVRELKPFGWQEVAIYFATIVGIVATNLLVGVLIGLGLALLKLLYTFSHLEVRIHTEPDTNNTTIALNGAATFVRLPKLAAALESVPPGTSVRLDIDRLHYIDHACLDLVSNWRKQHVARDGQAEVPWEDLQQRNQDRDISLGIAPRPALAVANATSE